jgi:hypothetical protein
MSPGCDARSPRGVAVSVDWESFPSSPLADSGFDWDASCHQGLQDPLYAESVAEVWVDANDAGGLFESMFGDIGGANSDHASQEKSVRCCSVAGRNSGCCDDTVPACQSSPGNADVVAADPLLEWAGDGEVELADFALDTFFAVSAVVGAGVEENGAGVCRKRRADSAFVTDCGLSAGAHGSMGLWSGVVCSDHSPLNGGVVGKRISKAAVAILTQWLMSNKQNPYPTLSVKKQLARQAGLSSLQVSNWMTNMRKRHVLPVLRGHKNPKTDVHFGFLKAVHNPQG